MGTASIRPPDQRRRIVLRPYGHKQEQDSPREEQLMTLTIGTGPFGDQGEKVFNFEFDASRDHVLYFEDSPRRVRVEFNCETVADSRRVKLMHEKGHLPLYYFPEEDVRRDLLEPTDHTSYCPFKGEASYWSMRAGEKVAENAVWGYSEPIDSAPPISGYLAFYWRKMGCVVSKLLTSAVLTRSPINSIVSSGRATTFSCNIL